VSSERSGQSENPDPDERELIQGLLDPMVDRKSRLKHLDAVRRSGSNLSLPALEASLESLDGQVRASALWTLSAIGTREALGLMTRRFSTLDRNDVVIAAYLLGRHKFKDAAAEIALALNTRTDLSEADKTPLFRALGYMGDNTAVPELRGALTNRRTQNAAVKALVDIGSEESLGALAKCLGELTWPRRRWVRKVLRANAIDV
jgi:HEAT repeat protein